MEKYEGTTGIAAFVGLWYVEFIIYLETSQVSKFSTDELFKSSAYLTDAYLFDVSSKHSSLPSASPFNVAFATKHQFFTWLEEEGNQLRLQRFGRAMMATAGYEDGGNVSQADGNCLFVLKNNFSLTAKGFDWGSLPEGSLIVDVGGGIGSTSMSIAKAFPHLRFCIQDRPKTVEMGLSARFYPIYLGLIEVDTRTRHGKIFVQNT